MKIFCVLLSLLILFGCGGHKLTLDEQLARVDNAHGQPVDPISFDFGPIDRYNHCDARPRRPLTAKEECQLAVLRSRCSKADDCMVSCMSSPDAVRVTHGCSDKCPLGSPPLDFSKCESNG
jgi:hypothetical protein